MLGMSWAPGLTEILDSVIADPYSPSTPSCQDTSEVQEQNDGHRRSPKDFVLL
ncbi:hypothetical protein FVEN_g12944 [Fusarium venenatum]|nr:hypothetical protein FVEN_g12944 [Fusarium venenatum]